MSATVNIFRGFLIISNILIFFLIVLNTLISFQKLICISILYILLSFAVFKYVQKSWSILATKKDFFLILIPSFFNLFFLINYTFSSHQQIETYRFENASVGVIGTDNLGNKIEGKSTTITLENNIYEEFYFARTFLDFEKMRNKNTVKYTFENGIFGLKVIKDYQFSNVNHKF